MKRITIVLLALVAMFVFACKNETNANNDTAGTTDTAATSSTATANNTATTATDTSGTTGTTGSVAVTSTAPLSGADADFAKKAAEGGMMEVDLGQLAAAKATSQDVKDFGNRMVSDHGKANDELKSIAAQKNFTLPTTPSAEETKTSNELSKKTGAAFDKAYMSDMVKDHEKDVKEFENASKNLKDPDLKNWASKTLTVIQDHLNMAKQTASKLK
jgi:putative membrane protein